MSASVISTMLPMGGFTTARLYPARSRLAASAAESAASTRSPPIVTMSSVPGGLSTLEYATPFRDSRSSTRPHAVAWPCVAKGL
jgi:hypothetical protein